MPDDIAARVANERARIHAMGQYLVRDDVARMTWALDAIEALLARVAELEQDIRDEMGVGL